MEYKIANGKNISWSSVIRILKAPRGSPFKSSTVTTSMNGAFWLSHTQDLFIPHHLHPFARAVGTKDRRRVGLRQQKPSSSQSVHGATLALAAALPLWAPFWGFACSLRQPVACRCISPLCPPHAASFPLCSSVLLANGTASLPHVDIVTSSRFISP